MNTSTKKMTSITKTGPSPTTKNIKHRRSKDKTMENQIPPIINGFMANELAGDSRTRRERPEVWVSETRIGMDKIRAKTNAGKYFVDFASSATVHGFNHLTAPHRFPIERFLTLLIIGSAFTGLILLSLNFWDRYQKNATMFILERDYRNYEVTKPATVFRPTTRVNESAFPEVFKRHGVEDTPEAREFFTFLANATYLNMDETPLYEGVNPDKWLTIVWELKYNLDASGDGHKTSGQWIVTERGICLIFGSTIAEYSSYEYWIQNNWTIVPQPAIPEQTNYKLRQTNPSFKVELHPVSVSAYHPQEIPDFENVGLWAAYREITQVMFVTQEITTAESVKMLSLSQKKCKTMSEGGLTMWPVYTQNMCITECRYKLMLKQCGCHPFFARPMPGIPACGAKQLRCIGEHRSDYIRIDKSSEIRCECYPTCDITTFDPKVATPSNLKFGSPEAAFGTVISVYPMYKIRRELVFGLNDFMASVGGAAGLLLGASVISFSEFFYWATLRLCWYRINLRRAEMVKLKLKKPFYEKASGRPDNWLKTTVTMVASPNKNDRETGNK